MAGKGTVTVRKTGRMCVFSLYFKALDRKGVRKVFQNNFSVCLFNNWQQEYNERNKKEQTPSQNYWPAHPRPRPWGDVCVCVCVDVCMDFYSADWDSSVPHPPARTAIHPAPLGKFFFWLSALSFLAFHFKLFPSAQFISLNSCPPFKILWEVENCIWCVTPTETSEISLGHMNYVCVCTLGLNIQCVYVCVCTCVYTQ